MENWKKKYENLEEEKRALFEEMMEQNSKEKNPLENDKENMRNYIQQLEKSSELPHNIKLNHAGSVKPIRLKVIYSLNCINFIHLTELWTCQVKPLHPKPGSMIYVQISYHLLC